MIALGLIGRPDVPECHDGAACLVIDGTVIGALEVERLSRRRHAPGEGPEAAARVLLSSHGISPHEVAAVGYGWADAQAPDDDQLSEETAVATAALTETILPSLGRELGCREIVFYDHHRCHAAHSYFLNEFPRADVLVIDGWGGDGSVSLYRAEDGDLQLLERYGEALSLGIFYETAAAYAGLGWNSAGKLMGLSSYAAPSERRFISFDASRGGFSTGFRGDTSSAGGWSEIFMRTAFPFCAGSANTFDYVRLAADVQATIEDCGVALVRRLHALSGSRALLLGGGVTLNAHMNRAIARSGIYAAVASTVAPHDAGAAVGAGLLAARQAGDRVAPLAPGSAPPIFLGPAVRLAEVEAALRAAGVDRETPDDLAAEVARSLSTGQLVAWFEGPSEFGPRALGARSLLAHPSRRTSLDRLNQVKGRAPWRPTALSLRADAFPDLLAEPPVAGLTEYMLCTHVVDEARQRDVQAGVHVDGTTRAQSVLNGPPAFSALLDQLRTGNQGDGVGAVVNTSLNTGGRPMVLTPAEAIKLWRDSPQIDRLVMPPYVVSRGAERS